MIGKNTLFSCLFFSFCCLSLLQAQVQQAFEPRFSEQLNGDVTIIANNMLSRTASDNYDDEDKDNHDFFDNVYVDIDNDPTTFNSSNAVLENPLGDECTQVKKVYLYWAAADIEKHDGSDNEPTWNFDDVKLMLPGETNYTTVTADEVIHRGRDFHFSNDPYVCVKDITNRVMALSSPYGTYQVANVEAKTGSLFGHQYTNIGTSGGWQIVYIYENNTSLPRNITIFDGYAHVTKDDGYNDFDILFDGFSTIPSGPVNARVVIGSLEGDRNILGDQLQILDASNTYVPLATTERPSNNFFNSKITVNGTNFTNRNPASTNTLGFDAAVFELNNTNNSIIANNQTETTLRLTSDQETYGLYLLGLSVEVYMPIVNPFPLTATPALVDPGGSITYGFEITNSGNDDAINMEVSTTLSLDVELVEPILGLPSGVTYTYDASTRELTFFIEDGLADVDDPTLYVNYDVVVQEQCHFLEFGCPTLVESQLTATFNGVYNTDEVFIVSSGIIDACGNGNALSTTTPLNSPNLASWTTPSNDLDRVIECGDQNALDDAQSLFPNLSCSNLTPTKITGPLMVDSNCPFVASYTNQWTFTDACGRTLEPFIQTIRIKDTTPPTAINPTEVIVSCNADVPLPDPNVVIGEDDNCTASPVVAFVDDISNGESCPEIITRTYRVSDDCNNTTTVTQTITINDVIDPTASSPEGISVSCVSQIPTPDPNAVIDEADNCTASPVVAFISDVSDNRNCPETITRTYSVTDDCDNSINVTQVITINDISAPVASNPSDINVECSANIPQPDISIVIPTDNCTASPTVAFVSDVSDNKNCPETITRTYSVTDDCDNSINVTQVITINDITDPVASNPGDITVECTANIPAPDVTVVNAPVDNCTASPTVAFESDVSDNRTCPETITRNYSITDDCGNGISVTQTFTVLDTTPPIINNVPSESLSIACENVPSPPVLTATDNCSNTHLPTQFNEEFITNLTGCNQIIRTWIAADSCGNTTTFIQTITLTDTIPPVISNLPPANPTYDCENVPSPPILTATDNCSSTTMQTTFTELSNTVSQGCGQIVRLWVATDPCGNTSTFRQTITVEDTKAPTLETPLEAEITVSCSAIPDVNEVRFVDNCSSVLNIALDRIKTITDAYNYTLNRTWKVSDNCNNQSIFTQTIHVKRENEKYFKELILCIEDEAVNLNSLISDREDATGIWESEALDLLTGDLLDPANIPLGNYVFTHTYTSNDCIWETTVNVNVNDDCVFYPCIQSTNDVSISKLVTGNNDNINDYFEVAYILNENSNHPCDITISVKILNRWGNLIFESDNYNNDWGGTSPSNKLGSLNSLPTGTYYYIVELINSGLKPIQGYILVGNSQ